MLLEGLIYGRLGFPKWEERRNVVCIGDKVPHARATFRQKVVYRLINFFRGAGPGSSRRFVVRQHGGTLWSDSGKLCVVETITNESSTISKTGNIQRWQGYSPAGGSCTTIWRCLRRGDENVPTIRRKSPTRRSLGSPPAFEHVLASRISDILIDTGQEDALTFQSTREPAAR
jgi:hypothetical protein